MSPVTFTQSAVLSAPRPHTHPYATTAYDESTEGENADFCRKIQTIVFVAGLSLCLIGNLFFFLSFGSTLPGTTLLLTAVFDICAYRLGVYAWDSLNHQIEKHKKRARCAHIYEKHLLHHTGNVWNYPRLEARYQYYEERIEEIEKKLADSATQMPSLKEKQGKEREESEEIVLAKAEEIFNLQQEKAILRLKMAWVLFLEENPTPHSQKRTEYFKYRKENFHQYTTRQYVDQTYSSFPNYFVIFKYASSFGEYMSLSEVLEADLIDLKDKIFNPNRVFEPSKATALPASPKAVNTHPLKPPSSSAPNTLELRPTSGAPIPLDYSYILPGPALLNTVRNTSAPPASTIAPKPSPLRTTSTPSHFEFERGQSQSPTSSDQSLVADGAAEVTPSSQALSIIDLLSSPSPRHRHDASLASSGPAAHPPVAPV